MTQQSERAMQILDHALNCVPKGGEHKVAAARAAVAQLVDDNAKLQKDVRQLEGLTEVQANLRLIEHAMFMSANQMKLCEHYKAKFTDAEEELAQARRMANIGALVTMKFESGNSVPVERITVRASEIAAIDDALLKEKTS